MEKLFTIITDSRTKLELASKELVPDIVILDPQFPKFIPPNLVATLEWMHLYILWKLMVTSG